MVPSFFSKTDVSSVRFVRNVRWCFANLTNGLDWRSNKSNISNKSNKRKKERRLCR